MDSRNQIKDLMENIAGEGVNVCGEVFKILKKEKKYGGELLQYFCEVTERIKSSEEIEAPELFTEGEILDYTKAYGKIIDGILEKLLYKKCEKKIFYQELWDKITLKELFESEKEQIFALYYVWIDARIPYFELPDTLRLEESEYQSIIDKLRDKIQEARFVLYSDFEQWPEVCYLLLRLMEDLEDMNEKTVFLSCVMQIRDRMLRTGCMQNSAEKMEE